MTPLELVRKKRGRHFVTNELIQYVTSLLPGCTNFLELGTANGVVVSAYAECFPHVQFDCVDSFERAPGTPAGHKDLFEENTNGLENIKLYQGRTEDVLPTLPRESYDIVFVDADHSYAACSNDLAQAYRLIRDGGFILAHDMNLIKEVKIAVADFVVRYDVRLVFKHEVAVITRT